MPTPAQAENDFFAPRALDAQTAEDDFFTSYSEPKAAPVPVPEGGITAADVGRAAMAGGAQLAGGVGWLARQAGAERVGRSIGDVAERAVEYWQEGMSPAAKEAASKEIIREAPEGEGVFGYEWGDATPGTVGLAAAGSILPTMAGMGVGGVATKGIQAVGRAAGGRATLEAAALPGTEAAKQLGRRAAIEGAAGYGLGEAGVAAPSLGAEVYRRVMELPEETLAQHPEYAALKQKHGEAAREMIADAASLQAAGQGGITTAALSAPMGALVGKVLSGFPLATTRPRAVGVGAAGEAGQEFFQSGAEQLAANIAIQEQADPTQRLMQGVLEQAVGGAAAGGVMGGAFGLAGGPWRPTQERGDAVNIEEAKRLDENVLEQPGPAEGAGQMPTPEGGEGVRRRGQGKEPIQEPIQEEALTDAQKKQAEPGAKLGRAPEAEAEAEPPRKPEEGKAQAALDAFDAEREQELPEVPGEKRGVTARPAGGEGAGTRPGIDFSAATGEIAPPKSAKAAEGRDTRTTLTEALDPKDSRWDAMRKDGATNRDLSRAIATHFGSAGRSGGDWKASASKQVRIGKGSPRFVSGGQRLDAKSTTDLARDILGIEQTEKTDEKKSERAEGQKGVAVAAEGTGGDMPVAGKGEPGEGGGDKPVELRKLPAGEGAGEGVRRGGRAGGAGDQDVESGAGVAPAERKYVRVDRVDTPAQGDLAQAREGKQKTWKRIKNLRERIKAEPLGGDKASLRLKLLKAQGSHNEWKGMEVAAKEAIEKRANELGQTTKRPKKKKEKPSGVSVQREGGKSAQAAGPAQGAPATQESVSTPAQAAATAEEREAAGSERIEGPTGEGEIPAAQREAAPTVSTGRDTAVVLGETPDQGYEAEIREAASIEKQLSLIEGYMSKGMTEEAASRRAQREVSGEEQAPEPLGRAKTERIAQRIVGRHGLLDKGVRYVAVDDVTKLPQGIQEDMREAGAEGDVQGVLSNRTVYLVSDRLASEADVERVILHEVYGHHGARRLFGAHLKRAMRRIYESVGGDKGIRELGAKHGFNMRSYFRTAEDLYADDVAERHFMLADELLAHMAQKGPKSLPAKVVLALQEFLGALRSWLTRNGYRETAKMGDADLAYLLRQMRKAAKAPKDSKLGRGGMRFHRAPATDKAAFSRMATDFTKGLDSLLDKTADLDAVAKRLHTASLHPATQQLFHGRGELHFMTQAAAQEELDARTAELVDGFYDPVSKTFLNREDSKRIVNAAYGGTVDEADKDKLESQEYRRTRNIAEQEAAAVDTGIEVEEIPLDDPRLEGLNLPGDVVTRFARVAEQEPRRTPYSRISTAVSNAIGAERSTALAEVKQWLSDVAAKLRPGALGALTLRQLADVGGKLLPQFKTLVSGMERYQTARNMMVDESQKIANRWRQLPRKVAAALAEVMHLSTIAGVDPSTKYEAAIDPKEANRRIKALNRLISDLPGERGERYNKWRKEIDELQGKIRQERARQTHRGNMGRLWAGLPEEAKEMYKEARDSYVNMQKRMEGAIIRRIEEAELNEDVRAAAMLQVRQEFEKAREAGPYFPLQRQGRYFISAQKPTGRTFTDKKTGEKTQEMENAFYLFDSPRERRVARPGILEDGWTITKSGKQKEMAAEVDAVSEQFIVDTIEAMNEKLGSYEGKKAADVLYQSFLESMPYMSHRVHFIHRKKTPGFSQDALRAYAFNMAHMSNQVARMEVAPEWARALGGMDDRVNALENEDSEDATRAADLRDEATKWHEWAMKPNGSKWASMATTGGFVWYLGLSPAAGLVNLSQTAIIAFPELAARFGSATKAARALGKATKEVVAARRKWSKRGEYSTWKSLSDDERKAFEAWKNSGEIDTTQTQMLMGMADTDSAQYSPKTAKALEMVGSMFQEAEVVNRETTLLAGYRLARGKGQGHKSAVKAAADSVWESHYDYSNVNRSRFMRSNWAKVLFLFRSYSQHTTYYLVRNAWQSLKGETPEVRDEARKKLVGVLGMTGVFAGTKGLPLAGVAYGVANAVQALFGDEDDPWDAETATRDFFADYGLAGKIVDRGLLNAMTGADWSGRTSLNDLWFRTPDASLEGRQLWANYMAQFAGPVAGIGESIFRAAEMAGNGHFARAAETGLPKFMKAPLRAVRYAGEGVTSMKGDPVVPREALTPFDLVMQATGFTPDMASAQWDANRAAKAYERTIQDRRRDLMGAYALAVEDNDEAAVSRALGKIQAFNRAQPTVRINRTALRQSMRTRARMRAEADAGIFLQKRLRGVRAETRVPM